MYESLSIIDFGIDMSFLVNHRFDMGTKLVIAHGVPNTVPTHANPDEQPSINLAFAS